MAESSPKGRKHCGEKEKLLVTLKSGVRLLDRETAGDLTTCTISRILIHFVVNTGQNTCKNKMSVCKTIMPPPTATLMQEVAQFIY